MTRKLQAGFVLIMLLTGITCKKESTNRTPSVANASQATVSASSEEALPVNSVYELDYDWGCSGYYGSTTMTLKTNGTWTNGEGYTGLWVQDKNILIFTFDGLETTYSGDINGTQASGIMTDFIPGSLGQGCFTLTKSSNPNFKGNKVPGQPDSRGITKGNSIASASVRPGSLASSNKNVQGKTVIFSYDWGCSGYPNTITKTFNSDGTWYDDEGFTGLWVKGSGILIFTYDNYETTYSGNIHNGIGNVNGIMTTFTTPYNSKGCFTLTETGGAKINGTHTAGQPNGNYNQ